MKVLPAIRWFTLILSGVLLAACNLPQNVQTLAPDLNLTQAFQTIEVGLTQVSTSSPPAATTLAPTDTVVESPDATTTVISSPSPTVVPSPKAICLKAAPGVPIDVTIPDDTLMQPGDSFTKVWRLINDGVCPWTQEFTVELFSGDAMDAPTRVFMPERVAPGERVDISVDMTAPNKPGTYQGNWKLRDPQGEWFGIGPNGNSPFWVRIIVVPLPTETPTPATPTATVTPTPAAQVQAEVTLSLDDIIDLDSAEVNVESGGDLAYRMIEEKHVLEPLENVEIGIYGTNRPVMEDCRTAALQTEPLQMEELEGEVYLCYRTDLGLPGYALWDSAGSDDLSQIQMEILTWTLP